MREYWKNKTVFSDIILLVLLGVMVRSILYPFSDIVDADAVSRIFITEQFLDDPEFISSGIWLPFHYYINAIGIIVFQDRVFGPNIIHIVITSFSAWPLYLFIKNISEKKSAFAAALLYTLFPLAIRNSLQPLSAVVCLFFVFLGLYYVSQFLYKTNKIKQIIFAGIFLTIACGFRYEAWLISAFVGVIILIHSKFKEALIYGLIVSSFPLFWMIGNELAHNDFLYGIHSAYSYNETYKAGEKLAGTVIIQRWIFSTYSLLYNLGFGVSILLIFMGLKHIKSISKKEIIWSSLFFLMLMFYIKKNLDGSLILQHRFTITLLALFLPIFAFIYSKSNKKIRIAFLLLILLNVPISMYSYKKNIFSKHEDGGIGKALRSINYHTSRETASVSQLKSPSTRTLKQEITLLLNDKSQGLLMDNLGWESTFYLKIHSGLKPENIYNSPITFGYQINDVAIENLLEKHKKGIILLKDESKFSKRFEINDNTIRIKLEDKEILLKAEKVSRIKDVSLYIYNHI